ncbi:hypothetical protein M422DRAFT_69557 [Sphaerobolus stellatus SS14]|uniref:Uncharacterized protein n=1 Tax=Sphaerobolus stellatus (strain SS14) TaxID=990650 RepID=A0A0C9VI99_SPHS4|nr:hypothetical protein M422DRAFT_69557 [Sphaerobolus stellatus SS14]
MSSSSSTSYFDDHNENENENPNEDNNELASNAPSFPSSSSPSTPTTPTHHKNPRRTFHSHPKDRTSFSLFFGSESTFLAILFGAIALLLPTLFFFISRGAVQDVQAQTQVLPPNPNLHPNPSPHAAEMNAGHIHPHFNNHQGGTAHPIPDISPHSPLAVFLTYLPTITTVFTRLLALLLKSFTPFISFFSLILYIIWPFVLFLQIIYWIFVLYPWKTVNGLIWFFYPLYVFGGVAVLASIVVGLAGRLVVEGGKAMVMSGEEKPRPRSRDRKKLR